MLPELDSSYAFAFSYAATHHARWGSDFISTYGPFGCVIRTMDLGGLVWVRLAASLVLAAGLGVATSVYRSGEEAVFRLVTFNRDAGFWLSPLASGLAELPQLLEDRRGRPVTAIAFEANALVRALIPSITVTWFHMVPRDAPRGDSAAGAAAR